MANAAVPVIAGDGAQFVAAGIDTGQVRRRNQSCPFLDVLDHLVGAITGAGVGAIGDGDELGFQHFQPFDGLPEGILHPFTVGRKKLETDRYIAIQICQALVERFNLTCTVKTHLLFSLSCNPSVYVKTDVRTSKRLYIYE